MYFIKLLLTNIRVIILIIFFLFSSNLVKAQRKDTIIKTEILECKFSFEHHGPIYIKYKLYKGGGNCNRSKFKFRTGNIRESATSNDYIASGYDIGHLVPAEDFAYNCTLEEKTFYFYNSVPQTPNLNRGIWKTYENKIRNLSQTDTLMIICGGIYDSNKTLPNSKIKIPIYCWKVVYDLKTKNIVYILWFTNNPTNNSVKTTMLLKELEKKIGFNLKF